MAQAKLPNFVVVVALAIVFAVVVQEFFTKSVLPGHVAAASLFGNDAIASNPAYIQF